MWKDLAVSLRMLLRSPVFTAAAVLSLALGIGANTAIFSLLDQVVLRSLPVEDPERLVVLHTDYNAPGMSTSDNREAVFSEPMYRDLRDRDPAFAGVIARSGAQVALAHGSGTEPAAAEIVSGNFFRVLGVGAAVGRVLVPADDGAPGANPVAVLSHGFWSSRFGGNRGILNQTVLLNGHPFAVIGVVEQRFKGISPGSTPDVYVPISMLGAVRPTWNALGDRRLRWLNVFARLKPGFTPARAQAASDVFYRSVLESELAGMGNMRDQRSRAEFLNHRALLRPAAQGVNGLGRQWGRPLEVLMGMVGLVLLIACANVAGLMAARATRRRREIAIRLALGAGRAGLVRQLLVESLLLALAGGVLGLLVAAWTTNVLIHMLPRADTGAWLVSAIDSRVLGFTVALSVLSGLLLGLVPALQATRPEILPALKDQSSAVASGVGAARLRKALVVAQVALSLLLATGAGLFVTSLRHLTDANLGFRTQQVLTFSVDAALSRPKPAPAAAYYRELLDRLGTMRGAAGVAAADGGPFSGSARAGNLTIEGYRAGPDENVGSSMVAVSPGFFRAMGIPLRTGREFGERDDASAPKVVAINEAFARRYFAGRNPVGMYLMFGESNRSAPDREIVGVVADFRTAVRTPPREELYYPYPQWDGPARLTFYVRTAGDASHISSDVRQLIRSTDPAVPLGEIKPLDLSIRDSIYTDRLIALLAMVFGGVALLLAALGLYGVVAYAVERRTAEIGIRVALGAAPAQVLRMMLSEAGRMAALGIALGLAGALAAGRYVQAQLFGVEAGDPAILGGAATLLFLVAVAAALVPGWRAARINPVSALKHE